MRFFLMIVALTSVICLAQLTALPAFAMDPEAARKELEKLNIPYTSDEFVRRAEQGDSASIGLFLAAGMDPDARDAKGRTALGMAAVYGHIQLCEALEEAECKDLAANDCFNNENCRGIYGPSECCEPPTCDPPICTDDMVFYRCVKIPSGEVEQARMDRALCEKTQGAWRRGPHLEPGRCDCPSYAKVNSPNPELYHELGQYYFIKDRGCIPARTLCEEMGGIWKKPDIAIVEKRKDISKGNCVTVSIYTVMEWDEVNELCVLSRINDPNPKCLIDGEKVDVGKLLQQE